MNCKICGSSQFCMNDGITYCTECQSQIEETQTEQTSEPVRTKDGSSPAVKKARKEKTKEYTDWITVEYYNRILLMQVSALIKLGASQNLKKTVLHIWSKYLQKCEIAFRTDYRAKDGKPHLGPVPAKRDVQILYGDKKLAPARLKRGSRFSLSSVNSSSVTSGEDNSGSDSEGLSDAVSIKSEGTPKRKIYSSHANKLIRKSALKRKNWSIYSRQAFNMTLEKTLCICYLGLRYTEDQLSLLDLIRLTYEEKIPYINIVDKMPSTMKLQDTDVVTFLKYIVPDAYSLLKTSRDIAKFLQLPELKEPSVFLSVSRFTKEFNLPDDIKQVVKILMENHKEQLSKWQQDSKLEDVPHDYQALAFIIIALKALFVLNGKFEIEHSTVMKKLNTLCEDRKYFEWKEWKEQSVIKEYLFLCENPGHCTINKLDGLSADKIISKYPFPRLKVPTDEENSEDVPVIKNNINNMLCSIVNIPRFSGNVPTSFPLRSATNSFIEEWRSLPMFKETQDIDFSLLQRDFSSYSLLFNPLKLNKEENELSYLLMTSLYTPKAVDLGGGFHLDAVRQIIKTSSKYWFFNPLGPRKSDICTTWFEKLPNSFKWLINYFSKYAYCNKITLYKEVAKIEKTLFLQRKCVHSIDVPKLNNKITM